MTKYVICEKMYSANHAGPKARTDVADILAADGWRRLFVQRREDGSTIDKFCAIPVNLQNWIRVLNRVKQDDVLLIQFPLAMYPQVSRTAVPIIKKIRKKKVRLIFLIHDLESLRGYDDSVEQDFLSCADALIVHNDVMRDYVLQRGYCSNVVSLGVFDYLVPPNQPRSKCIRGIDIAGNLNPEKAGYIYKLAEEMPEAEINLYGPNIVDDNPVIASWYKGSFPPDRLAQEMKGRFGLVWDGNSIDTCSGEYGEYLKYNNPHKLSMYLAIGKPVIVWKQSASATLVESFGIGYCASNLKEAVDYANSVSTDAYRSLKTQLEDISRKIRDGYFLKRALSSIEIIKYTPKESENA